MLVQTKYLGEVTIAKEDIITFPSGLPGFQDETKFIILNIEGNDVLQIMQSVQTADLAFIIVNPHAFYQEYTFKLDDATVEKLTIKDDSAVVIYTIITLKDPFETSTINLKAPLIINSEQKLAKQYILNSDEYPLKASISSVATPNGKGV